MRLNWWGCRESESRWGFAGDEGGCFLPGGHFGAAFFVYVAVW